jgi:hypothetical protein
VPALHKLKRKFFAIINNHQVAAILAVTLAATIYFLLDKVGVPHKIVVSATILTILVVACFWTLTDLGPYSHGDDDDEE